MKQYVTGTIFKKLWFWFETPHDVPGADMVNFFTYSDGNYEGFTRTQTLTSVIALSATLDEIWSKTRKKFIQRQIEQGRSRGVTVAQSSDFTSFYPLFKDFRSSKKLPRISYKVLSQNGTLFLARFAGEVIAGGIFITDGTHVRAWVLASRRLDGMDGRMRDIIGDANRMVIWEAISWAKQNGYAVFDMGGIDPDSKDSGQRSLAEFKEAFGGERKSAFYYHKVYSAPLKVWMRLRKLIA